MDLENVMIIKADIDWKRNILEEDSEGHMFDVDVDVCSVIRKSSFPHAKFGPYFFLNITWNVIHLI